MARIWGGKLSQNETEGASVFEVSVFGKCRDHDGRS
jgi:hypothetical protein